MLSKLTCLSRAIALHIIALLAVVGNVMPLSWQCLELRTMRCSDLITFIKPVSESLWLQSHTVRLFAGVTTRVF